MNRFVVPCLAAGVLILAGCTKENGWEYETVSGPNDRVLNDPIAQGWEPIGISTTRDGQRWFILKRQIASPHPVNWQYKTVISKNGDAVLDTPENQGWSLVGTSEMPDGSKWFLLRQAAAPQKAVVSSTK
jgi:hypothetical protein